MGLGVNGVVEGLHRGELSLRRTSFYTLAPQGREDGRISIRLSVEELDCGTKPKILIAAPLWKLCRDPIGRFRRQSLAARRFGGVPLAAFRAQHLR